MVSQTAVPDFHGGEERSLSESADRRALGADPMNRRIIARLQEDGRVPYSVIAEIVAATTGIGAVMMRAKRFLHVDKIMACIIVIGLLGLLFDFLFRLAHRLLFPYLDERNR